MELEQIVNYRKVSDTISTAGQPTRSELELLSEKGFKTVVNIAMDDSDGAIPEEEDILTGHGLEYHHIPVVWENPQQYQLGQFFDLMDRIKGQKTFVHCAKNYRVSAFMYLYYILRLGLDEKQAKGVMLPDWNPDQIWTDFIQTALNQA